MSAEWTPELATGIGIVLLYLAQRPHPPDRDDGAALRVGIRHFGRHAVKDTGRLRSGAGDDEGRGTWSGADAEGDLNAYYVPGIFKAI